MATLAVVTVVDTSATTINLSGNNGVALTFAGTALHTFNASGITTGGVTYASGVMTTDIVATGSLTGNDTLNFANATSLITINESAGTNALTGSLTFASTITGGSGADTIVGGNVADTIVGGAGNDNITGGLLNDTLTGGAGADRFILTTGGAASVFVGSLATTASMDRITDFVTGTDDIVIINGTTAITSVVLTTVTVATAADVAAVLTAIGTSVAVSAGAVAQVGVITVSAGAMAGTYLLVNDTVNAAAALDQLINITGVSGTITTADFAFA